MVKQASMPLYVYITMQSKRAVLLEEEDSISGKKSAEKCIDKKRGVSNIGGNVIASPKVLEL